MNYRDKICIDRECLHERLFTVIVRISRNTLFDAANRQLSLALRILIYTRNWQMRNIAEPSKRNFSRT